MRVIAGKHRGRVLASFEGEDVRPTADRVKESLFQILSFRLPQARVLDLFCGSGALGIECLSRGASEAVLNDSSKRSLEIAKANLQRVKEQATVLNMDYRACLTSVSGKFDLIFCDPPYKCEYLQEILTLVAQRKLLKKGGLVVFEGEREETPPLGWEIADFRRYGRTLIYMLSQLAEEKV